MKKILLLVVLVASFSCRTEKEPLVKQGYLRWIGDIEQDASLDDESFTLCHGDKKVLQYFNESDGFQYEGEKKAVEQVFAEKYKAVRGRSQDGMVRIRFIVNCKGEAGRFRVLSSDENYQPFEFSKKVTNQLLTITKSLKGWKTIKKGEQELDYYLYLTFKINDGQITEILP